MLIGARALKDITKPMLRVLQAVERGMIKAQYVEIEQIVKFTGQSTRDTEYWLKKCHKLDLVARWTGHFIGYELTIHGYDALALNALYEQGAILNFGNERGVGKESRVFFVQTPDSHERLIKLHRVGYTSFQQVKKKRRYTASKKHISALYSSRLSAESEHKWLEIAAANDLPVPKVYAKNRHIIVMDFVEGYDLVKVNELEEPGYVFEQVMDFIDLAWNKAGFVHGDLSEFNIIINQDAKISVIDFPQSVGRDLEEAPELLLRDIVNVVNFFNRRFRLNANAESLYAEITNSPPPELL